MRAAFAKYEGLGNDFVVVDDFSALAAFASHAIEVCDRHRGIGADGVLLIERAGSGVAMRVINPDGTRPEMCGNGIRCVAWHLVRTGVREAGVPFDIDTDAGPHRCRVQLQPDGAVVEVAMRAASLEPASIPVVAERAVLDESFEVSATTLRVSCVSMGNPHAVTFDDVDREARARLGPALQKHARLPQSANVGFARVIAPQRIELAVFERGAGFTEACGTGACACAVAAVETGRASRHRPIEVRLPGGALTIVVAAAGEPISMTGPARHVFDGELELS
ncbi:MAG TPA: diaminopimelate epimerase [Polyangiales bacterium]|jgi:diaminopimelate epimerase